MSRGVDDNRPNGRGKSEKTIQVRRTAQAPMSEAAQAKRTAARSQLIELLARRLVADALTAQQAGPAMPVGDEPPIAGDEKGGAA